MLVRGKYILTSAVPEEIRNGALRIQNGIITEIDEWAVLHSKFPDDQIAGAILELSKTDSATSVRKFVNKLSDSVAQAREVYESEKRKITS